jgi:transposase
MTHSFLGIDIAKDKFDVHLINDQGTWSGQFDNKAEGYKQLQKWLKKRRIDQLHACLEATGSYGEDLTYFLHEQGYQVSVINPKIIKHYGLSKMQRNKTDKLDARLIAQYCQKERPRLWQPPSEAARILKALTRRLGALIADRTREKNRLTAQNMTLPNRFWENQRYIYQNQGFPRFSAIPEPHSRVICSLNFVLNLRL